MSDQSTSAPIPPQQKKHAHNWNGGRVVASNGYILIFVGKEHHLADVRGYVYEHRLVAEQVIGRPLAEGEIVHHKDENKQNNSPENLEVVMGNAEHLLRHRRDGSALRIPGEENPLIKCACGCEGEFLKYDDTGRPRKYVTGHNTSATTRDLVVCYLECVPERGTPQFISEMLDLNKGSVRNVLTSLKKDGLVTRDPGRDGEWRLCNG